MTNLRNDDLDGALTEVGEFLRGEERGFASGWLHPRVAWAFYWQNGVIRQLVNRFATLMTKAGWDYINTDIEFNWSAVQSDLETIGLKRAMRSAAIWTFVFGGSAVFFDVDDGYQDLTTPLDMKRVRSFKGVKALSGYGLRPYGIGDNYSTAQLFEDRSKLKNNLIHRSRLAIVVANEVPTGLGYFGEAGFINSATGWPPSMIEGLYQSFCNWRGTERNIATIIRTKSLLSLVLKGIRQAAASPDSNEALELQAYLEEIAANLSNESLLTLDVGDQLNETDRNTAGLADLLREQKLSFVASTGVPKELVLMEAVGNLGDNSGPIDAYLDLVDGAREDQLTHVVVKATDLVVQAQAYDAALNGEEFGAPDRYTVSWLPVAEQDGEEIAKQRKSESDARKNDAEIGVPAEVLLRDPALARDYPGLAAYLEEQDKQRKAAAEAAEGAEGDVVQLPEGELESAASIARRLGVGTATVIKLIEAGKIQGTKVGARWRLHWPSVWQAIQGTNAVEEAEEAVEQAEEAVDRSDDAESLGLSESTTFGSVFGASVAMREVFYVLERVAPSPLSVLITGETGTGKEGVARGIHEHSGRSGEFAAINCAALPYDPEDLLEELRASIRSAQGGTLFLDEIGDLGESGQAALLRALGPELGDVRLVSATCRDVDCEWLFRLDLRNRVGAVEVEIPPLRDREDDVLELGRQFYSDYAKAAGWGPLTDPFTFDAISAMRRYTWPGNVRELKNAVERGALFAGRGRQIEAKYLQLRI